MGHLSSEPNFMSMPPDKAVGTAQVHVFVLLKALSWGSSTSICLLLCIPCPVLRGVLRDILLPRDFVIEAKS